MVGIFRTLFEIFEMQKRFLVGLEPVFHTVRHYKLYTDSLKSLLLFKRLKFYVAWQLDGALEPETS